MYFSVSVFKFTNTCIDLQIYLQEHHFVLGLSEGFELRASPPELTQFVLQTPSEFLRMALCLALPRGNELHQLRLTVLHQTLQLGVNLPALLQLLLSASLQKKR